MGRSGEIWALRTRSLPGQPTTSPAGEVCPSGWRSQEVTRVRTPVRKLALAAGFLTAAAASAVAIPAGALTGAAPVRAIVTLHGSTAVSAPGVRVLAVFPHVGSEVVVGTPSALRSLARNGRVAGVAPDDVVRFAGHDNDGGHSQF